MSLDITSSTSLIERDCPMVSGTAVCGKTTSPRSGSTGSTFGTCSSPSAMVCGS